MSNPSQSLPISPPQTKDSDSSSETSCKEDVKDSKEEKEFEIYPPNYQVNDINFKVIVIGNSGVGKTCLTLKATSGKFNENSMPTIGFEFYPFNVRYRGKIIRLDIWDTCGQETYRSLIKSFFINSSFALIVYAINDRHSFKSIENWIMECKNLCSPNIKIGLIGNKKDIEESL